MKTMKPREKVCVDTLVTDDAVLISKTRFLEPDGLCPLWRLGAVIGVNSLDFELNLEPDEMRELAGFLTRGATWIEKQRVSIRKKEEAETPPTDPKPVKKPSHLHLVE